MGFRVYEAEVLGLEQSESLGLFLQEGWTQILGTSPDEVQADDADACIEGGLVAELLGRVENAEVVVGAQGQHLLQVEEEVAVEDSTTEEDLLWGGSGKWKEGEDENEG